MRPSHANVFMRMAILVSERATCDRKHVGAVLVTGSNRVIATGYNSAPPGMPICDDVGHDMMPINGRDSCVRTIHAEANAIAQITQNHLSAVGCTLYTNTFPCIFCAKLLVSSGVRKVFYDSDYHNDSRVKELPIDFVKFDWDAF